jgi:hypothetical protein
VKSKAGLPVRLKAIGPDALYFGMESELEAIAKAGSRGAFEHAAVLLSGVEDRVRVWRERVERDRPRVEAFQLIEKLSAQGRRWTYKATQGPAIEYRRWRGAFQPGESYMPGEVVFVDAKYNGMTYIARTLTGARPPTDDWATASIEALPKES